MFVNLGLISLRFLGSDPKETRVLDLSDHLGFKMTLAIGSFYLTHPVDTTQVMDPIPPGRINDPKDRGNLYRDPSKNIPVLRDLDLFHLTLHPQEGIDEDHSHFKKKKRITIMPTLKPQANKDRNITFDLSDEESIIAEEGPDKKHEHKDGDLTTIKSVDDKKFRQHDFIFPGENIARFCKFTVPEELTDEDVTDVIDTFSDFKNPLDFI